MLTRLECATHSKERNKPVVNMKNKLNNIKEGNAFKPETRNMIQKLETRNMTQETQRKMKQTQNQQQTTETEPRNDRGQGTSPPKYNAEVNCIDNKSSMS